MLKLRSIIRSDERRAVFGAFLTLFVVMGAHALLETARDALFLASIPPSQLPWVYLAIAGVTLLVTQLQQRFHGAQSWRIAVIRWLLLSAVVTFAFWLVLPAAGAWALYALYIWSGVLATLVLVRFWQLLGDLFTTTQAKRLFALIGTGSVLGAILGSGLAGVLASLVDARHLVLAATVGLGLGAVVPWLLLPESDADGQPAASQAHDRSLVESLRVVASRPYTARLATLIFLSTVALTVADYLFKATVARTVAPADLGSFFALVYFALNVVSLLVQVLLVGWLVRRLSITLSLAVLPALLLVGAAGFIVAGGLAAALVLKAADGSFKYSLHRTATELLFVPLTERLRATVKALIDVVGQRGGQAVASLGILTVVGLGAGEPVLGGILAALLLGWIALARTLKPHYLDLFRGTLEKTLIQTRIDFPELDMSSLESMLATLNSENDPEVLAALELIAAEDKVRVIPALILYHPSDGIVIRSLDLFAHAERSDFVPIAKRLFETKSPPVRAAIIRALAAAGEPSDYLRDQLQGECPIVRATAAVCLMARGEMRASCVTAAIDDLFERGFAPALRAAAQAVQHLHHTNGSGGVGATQRVGPEVAALLVRLAKAHDNGVRRAAVAAMAEQPSPSYLPTLVELTATREARREARRAILALGDHALDHLEQAIADRSLHFRVRRHLPRTLAEFGTQRAAASLIGHLPNEPDGMVRFKILRALQQMRLANPQIDLDRRTLDPAVSDTVQQVCQLIDWRLTLTRSAQERGERATRVHHLLVQMLRDKETNALDRLFRLFALCYPAREMREITRGLMSPNAEVRSSSQELLESVLPSPLREAVTGLVDDLDDPDRLAAAGAYYTATELSYEAVLKRLLESRSESLRSLAVYHIGELGLGVLRGDLETITVHDSSYLHSIVDRVKGILVPAPPRELAYES